MFFASKQIKNSLYLMVACCSGMYVTKAMEQPTASYIEKQPELEAPTLMDAVRSGNRDLVESVLKAGADVHAQDKYGNTPLIIAALNGHKDIVELLLAYGANINKASTGGDTLLHEAALECNEDLLVSGLKAGADVNKADGYGNTPLSLAVCDNWKDIAELLRKFGAVK
jgi:ankyrin repeat protein